MPIRQTPIPEQLSRDVLNHLRQLGLNNVKAYRRWCVENGFGRGLNKNKANRSAELSVAQQSKNSSADAFQRLCERQPAQALQAISEGIINRSDIRNQELLAFSNAVTAATKAKDEPLLNRRVLSSSIKHLSQRKAKFIGSALTQRSSASSNCETLLSLVRVVQYCSRWVKPMEQWRPKSKSPRRQFQSLLQHLFAKYEPMPTFFNQVWASNDNSMSRYRLWYVRVAGGQNLRKCDLPIPYTSRMAHWFMRAPDNFSVAQALRFGQVIGLGGDQRIAKTIATTRLADNFRHDDFWVTVIRWFVDQPLLDPVQIGPIIDYINFQRFEPEIDLFRLGQQIDIDDQTFQPRQPNFSMKGRTATTLLGQVNRWHQRLANDNRHQTTAWLSSGIPEFSLLEGGESREGQTVPQTMNESVRHWTIRELLSSKSLSIEGRQLNHCVASYAGTCRTRRSSIWTMELERFSGTKKLLTIEVNLMTQTIVQIRGKSNRMPNEVERKIIQRWATEANLKVGALT